MYMLVGVCGIFPVGVRISIHAVECNEGTFQNSSLLYTGQPEVSTCIMCTSAVIMTSC